MLFSSSKEQLQLTPQMAEQLEESGVVKSFVDGDVILNENSFIRSIPIVKKGTLRVLRTDEDGKEILLYYIKSGESCIMSFLGGLHHDTSKVKAVAEGETEILFIPVEKISSFIRDYPEWLDFIFRLYHKRFEELLEVVNAIAFKKMDERLLHLLEKKAEVAKSKIIHTTHEQLANELGTAREVISRLLRQMEDEKLIKTGRNKITLM